jgi:hypothetical protein
VLIEVLDKVGEQTLTVINSNGMNTVDFTVSQCVGKVGGRERLSETPNRKNQPLVVDMRKSISRRLKVDSRHNTKSSEPFRQVLRINIFDYLK